MSQDLLNPKRFKKATRGTKIGPFELRSSFGKIDGALEYLSKTGGGTAQQKQAVFDVFHECRKWLKHRPVQNMVPVVRNLQQAAIAKMGQIDPNMQNAMGNQRTQATNRPLKSMSGVYKHERSAYKKSGKSSSPSATILDNKMFDLPNKSFEHLSESEFKKLAKKLNVGNVTYYRKMERLQNMTVIDPNGLLTWINGSAVHTGKQIWPYAMDKYGNVFTINDRAQSGQINHSSFNAGRDVVCAGTLQVDNGQLKLVSNNSGHYKPGYDELHNILNLLTTQQVDLTQAEAQWWDFGDALNDAQWAQDRSAYSCIIRTYPATAVYASPTPHTLPAPTDLYRMPKQ